MLPYPLARAEDFAEVLCNLDGSTRGTLFVSDIIAHLRQEGFNTYSSEHLVVGQYVQWTAYHTTPLAHELLVGTQIGHGDSPLSSQRRQAHPRGLCLCQDTQIPPKSPQGTEARPVAMTTSKGCQML